MVNSMQNSKPPVTGDGIWRRLNSVVLSVINRPAKRLMMATKSKWIPEILVI